MAIFLFLFENISCGAASKKATRPAKEQVAFIHILAYFYTQTLIGLIKLIPFIIWSLSLNLKLVDGLLQFFGNLHQLVTLIFNLLNISPLVGD